MKIAKSEQILAGESLLQGFRNRDVCRALFPQLEAQLDTRCHASGRITRSLQLLR